MSANAVKAPAANPALSWDFARPQDFAHPIGNDGCYPATAITGSSKSLESKIARDKLNFCYRAALNALETCQAGRYSAFDAQTTSNCCHGMALFACGVIRSVLQLDLEAIQREGEQKVQELGRNSAKEQSCSWTLRLPVIHLTCLYILGVIREVDSMNGCRTDQQKLQNIAPVAKSFCRQVIHSLQKQHSNLIASSYMQYAQGMNLSMEISRAPLEMWAKYVGSDYIRTDKKDVSYASNLFSMQVSLAYLIQSKAKVAVINDIFNWEGHLKGRYVHLFEGDGNAHLRPLSDEEIRQLQAIQQNEPVVVFGGCVYSDSLTKEAIAEGMQSWLGKFPELMLACDVFYDQFIKISDDPKFDSSPIIPDEELLRGTIDDHFNNTKGVSVSDPSLYCAAHISPASLKQVLAIWNADDEMELAPSFLLGIKLNHPKEATS